MSKTFGYKNKGGKNWDSCDTAYSDKEIEAIKDPEGGSETSMPTAIPSPFARLDLTKTAFKNIVKTSDLKASTKDGNVIASLYDEKLVSDCLDLAEILFNIESSSIKNRIKIVVWDRQQQLARLKSKSDMQRRFAETLEMYLEQDKGAYNFQLLKSLYLIVFDHKVVGCTSPVTLFFTTANDLSHAQIKLLTNDVTFDERYTPLYERDIDFQRYLYLLFAANPILSSLMRDFKEYLNKNLQILNTTNPSLYNEFHNLQAEDYRKNYSELNTGNSGEIIEVNGVALRTRKSEDMTDLIANSDFVIKASKSVEGGVLPLVLQNKLNKPLRYVHDNWDNSVEVPYVDREKNLERRILPGVHIQYPYLTVSDFLEPYLIRLVYPVNKEKFFDGNFTDEIGDDSKGFILPLTKLFFDYFTTKDLITSGQGKPSLRMNQLAGGGVRVVLRIPIARDEYIVFERIYHESVVGQTAEPDEEKNEGVIIEHQVGLTIFPFIKTNNPDPDFKSFYRVQLIDRDYVGEFKETFYNLSFYRNDSALPLEIISEAPRTRSVKNVDLDATSQVYVLNKEFDYIQVRSNFASTQGKYATGIILPDWKPYSQGQEEFSFAIDFGTTNTHIEYKVGNGIPKPFDIKHNDMQVAILFHQRTGEKFGAATGNAIRELIDHEFIPPIIDKESSIYKFPQRTVIAESKSLDIGTETYSLADFNIPFIYEKQTVKEHNKIGSNLKWAKNDRTNEKRVRAFFEEIMMLLRNKVLLNGGNLSKTKLYWFYPSSMTTGRMSSLRGVWDELFQAYFNAPEGTIAITESMAPFFYFKGEQQLQGGGSYKPVVAIDIGGGTTDVVVFQANQPKLLTSFKFAANSLFGDGFSEKSSKANGLVNKYYPEFKALLEKNNPDLLGVLNSIKEKNKSEDVNAFLFSLENNPNVLNKHDLSYNKLLSDNEDLKVIFIYFFTAIIYHIAALMKTKNIDLPRNIIFSGTGSKILNIITSDFSILEEFSKKIFEEVYQDKFIEGLSINTEKSSPKEVTCKGGLMLNHEDLNQDIRGIRATLTCLADSQITTLRYQDLSEAVKEETVEYVKKFNAFFINLNSQYRFEEYFNATPNSLRIFKNEIDKDLRGYLETGLEYSRKLDNITEEDREIGESLFFYPIIGAINNLIQILTR